MNRALVILVIVALLLAGMPAPSGPARAQSSAYAVVTHYPDYGGMEPARRTPSKSAMASSTTGWTTTTRRRRGPRRGGAGPDGG
jgi:hypothetical protein